MKKIFFAAVLFFYAQISNVFALPSVDDRVLDAVLGIESYMKWLYLFDGEDYKEKIDVKDYALIGKKEAFDAYKAKAQAGDVRAMCAVAECYDYGITDNSDLEKAFEWWSKAAEKNYAPALNALGTFYSPASYHVRLFGADEKKAKSLFEKSAEAGYGKAFANLDRFDEAISAGFTDAYVYYAAYLIEENEEENFSRAVELYSTAANQYSSSYAMYALMKLYSEGKNADLQLAKYWARRYSALHYAEITLEREKNAVLLPYIKKRADVGDVNSMFELSQLYGSNYVDAVNPSYRALSVYYLKKAADGGSKKAQKALAHAYEMGDGVETDKKKALDLYENALGEDDILSEISIRAIYIEALPPPIWSYVNFRAEEKESWRAAAYVPSFADSYEGISEQRAFDYLFKHADSDEDCTAALSACYFFGVGTEKDEAKAAELGFSLPAEKPLESEEGYLAQKADYLKMREEEEARLKELADAEKTAEAYIALFDFYDSFYNTLDVESKCFEILKKAAEQNHPRALRELARYYQDGKSCASDAKRGANLLQLAAGLGDDIAAEELAECFLQGFGVEYDFDEAIAWLLRSAAGDNFSAKSMLRRFGYSDVLDGEIGVSKNTDEANFVKEEPFEYDNGLDEDYDEDSFGALWGDLEGGDENALSEAEVELLGEPVVISLKNHALFSVGSHTSVKECALTFWASLLGGSSNAWKECIAYSYGDEILFEGEAFEERIRTLDAIFSLARAIGALDDIEIRFYFSNQDGIEGDLASIQSALYTNGEFQSSSTVSFVKKENLWYIKM